MIGHVFGAALAPIVSSRKGAQSTQRNTSPSLFPKTRANSGVTKHSQFLHIGTVYPPFGDCTFSRPLDRRWASTPNPFICYLFKTSTTPSETQTAVSLVRNARKRNCRRDPVIVDCVTAASYIMLFEQQ